MTSFQKMVGIALVAIVLIAACCITVLYRRYGIKIAGLSLPAFGYMAMVLKELIKTKGDK